MGQQQQELKGHGGRVSSVSFSRDGKRVVSGSHDNTIRIWGAETRQQQQQLNAQLAWTLDMSVIPYAYAGCVVHKVCQKD